MFIQGHSDSMQVFYIIYLSLWTLLFRVAALLVSYVVCFDGPLNMKKPSIDQKTCTQPNNQRKDKFMIGFCAESIKCLDNGWHCY